MCFTDFYKVIVSICVIRRRSVNDRSSKKLFRNWGNKSTFGAAMIPESFIRTRQGTFDSKLKKVVRFFRVILTWAFCIISSVAKKNSKLKFICRLSFVYFVVVVSPSESSWLWHVFILFLFRRAPSTRPRASNASCRWAPMTPTICHQRATILKVTMAQ